jgi:GT2 family glycosyltransferase
MNAAFRLTDAPFVLTLNADARPAPDFVTRLLALASHPGLRVGAVTGRLVRPAGADGVRRLDACGMRLTPPGATSTAARARRTAGSGPSAERVFGATGAASLFRREALDDAAVEGEIFDPRFHSFREDAELCFRLRERGWEVLYEPTAVAGHRRFNLPERAAMPPRVNYHSLKNRYLLRFYHQTAGNLLPHLRADPRPRCRGLRLCAAARALVARRLYLAVAPPRGSSCAGGGSSRGGEQFRRRRSTAGSSRTESPCESGSSPPLGGAPRQPRHSRPITAATRR